MRTFNTNFRYWFDRYLFCLLIYCLLRLTWRWKEIIHSGHPYKVALTLLAEGSVFVFFYLLVTAKLPK